MPLLALLLAFVAGIAMAVQGSLNAVLGKIIGILEATFIVHAVGMAVLAAALFLLHLGRGSFGNIPQAPWYLYLGGLLGVLIIYGVVVSIPQLGVAIATTAIIAGQVGTALVIDQLGLFGLEKVPFTWLKAVGIILLALGAKFMLMK
jgi:transporter family-2 protein